MKRAIVIAALLACFCRAQDAAPWWGALASSDSATPAIPFHPTNLFPTAWFQGNSNTVNTVNSEVAEWSGSADYAPGRDSRTAFSFGGSSSVTFFLYTMTAPVSNVTICAWVKAASFADYRGIFGNGFLGGASGYGLYQSVSASTFQYRKQSGFTDEAGSPHLSSTNWTFLVGVKSPGFIKFYVNGASITNIASSNVLDTSPTRYRIGANHSGGFPYVGRIQDAMLFDKELTPSEILQLYKWSQ